MTNSLTLYLHDDLPISMSGDGTRYLQGGRTLRNLGTATWSDNGTVESQLGSGLFKIGRAQVWTGVSDVYGMSLCACYKVVTVMLENTAKGTFTKSTTNT